MMPKCPFFQEPCLKEDCTAYETEEIYVGPKSETNLLSGRPGFIVRGDCLYRIKEFCHALNIEIPAKI